MSKNVFSDWNSNRGNPKGRLVLLLFRVAQGANSNMLVFVIMIPYLIIYRLFVEWILGIEIPYKTKIGRGLCLFHGQSLVINDGVVIGENCTLRHSTTIGNKKLKNGLYSRSPILGDNVDIGSNVCIIGEIVIGNNVQIGAGAVVVKDIPSNCSAVGNPARIVYEK